MRSTGRNGFNSTANKKIMKKSSVLSIRVTEGTREKVRMAAELEGVTENALLSKVITKHVDWDKFARDIGYLFVTKPFMRILLDSVDDNLLKRLAITTCKSAMKDSIIYINSEFSLDAYLHTFSLWLDASHIPFRRIDTHGTIKCIIQHNMGKKWSLYFITLTSSILNELGYHLKNISTNEHNVSYEIVKLAKT
ncbi:MAG: hypothetical protein HY222_06910 [Thaumarchaeota archaeon]|nr:hypothetical protein [Nitrososphaerota archaeon]MBI3642105.1 hypothetical protein [Nitrososphaerota archaeon]